MALARRFLLGACGAAADGAELIRPSRCPMHVNWRITLAQNAAKRAANAVHQDMARGLYGLATVAATAPFAGVFGNLLGIFGSFRGVDGEKTAIMAAMAKVYPSRSGQQRSGWR